MIALIIAVAIAFEVASWVAICRMMAFATRFDKEEE